MAVHKKHEEEISNKKQVTPLRPGSEGQASDKKEETQPEPVVVSDVVTETTERVEVIEEVTPDPLTEFKEKMTEEENPNSDMPAKKNFMWPILFVFVIAILLLGGIFVYKNNTKSEKVNVVTLTPTPTAMPEPTKAVDLTQYEIQVLNGSEVDGEAGRQRTNLEAEGFVISSVGNADDSSHIETIIQAKETVESAYLNKLKSVLELSFVVGDMEKLSEDADADVIVILGSETN